MDQLNPGDSALVVDVAGEGAFRRRLLELGLLPGTEVVRVGQAPLGDPLSFRVRGAVVCLRRGDANTIRVEPPPVSVTDAATASGGLRPAALLTK